MLELSFKLGDSFHAKDRNTISIVAANVLDFVGIIKELEKKYPKIHGFQQVSLYLNKKKIDMKSSPKEL